MPILVQTPARLHLGQIDLNGSLGRIFGGIGVTIEKPGVRLVFESNDSLEIFGPKRELVRKLALRYFNYYKLPHRAKITILSLIPSHIGLGSGTQLRLAVAVGLTRLLGNDIPVNELSGIMNHGESRSVVGTAAFANGGFIVDGGYKIHESPADGRAKRPAPVLLNRDFPLDWFVLLMIPENKRGLHGNDERIAFKEMKPMSEENVGRVCRQLVMQLLPALVERDSVTFGRALSSIQGIIGNYFAPVQGGLFSSEISAGVAAFCMENGAFAASQSSWGPALYAFVEGKKPMEKLAARVENYLRARNWNGKVLVTRPSNKGAVIRELSGNELDEIARRDIDEKDITSLGGGSKTQFV